jgi:hypothetical protein
MGDLVNLRRVKKAKARLAQDKTAEKNRRKFGRSLSERSVAEAEAGLATRRFEAHRRETSRNSDADDQPE